MAANGVTIARTSQLATNPATVVWSDNTTPFDGFVWLGLTLPSTSGYTEFWAYGLQTPQQLPNFIQVPVIAGQIDTGTTPFYNEDLDPPGSQYVAYWFSRQGVPIAPTVGSAVPFSITNSATTLTVPTLTIPLYSSAPPVPQT